MIDEDQLFKLLVSPVEADKLIGVELCKKHNIHWANFMSNKISDDVSFHEYYNEIYKVYNLVQEDYQYWNIKEVKH